MKAHIIDLACGHQAYITRLPGQRFLMPLPKVGHLHRCKICKDDQIVTGVRHHGNHTTGALDGSGPS